MAVNPICQGPVSPHQRGCSYIAGRWVRGRSAPFDSRDPFTGRVVWNGRASSAAQALEAVAHAHRRQEEWARRSLGQRKQILFGFTRLMRRRGDELAVLISHEIGKPLWESRQEVAAMTAKWSWTIKAHRERCRPRRLVHGGFQRTLLFKPYGVVLVIGPFNFPAHIPYGQILPSLLTGNAVIFKPSEHAPAVATWLMNLWLEAGLPEGVLQVVQGGAQTARHLLRGDIDVVYFTGSYETGVAIQRQLSDRPHIVFAMEAGGNNPLIVTPSGQTQKTYDLIRRSFLITAGQRCTCARRLIVVETPKTQRWLDGLWRDLDRLRVGGPFDDPQPFYGPLVSPRAGRRLADAWRLLIKRGARVIRPLQPINRHRTLFRPGVCEMICQTPPFDEEIFGPVIVLYRVKSFDEALALANRTRFGLAAGLVSSRPREWEIFRDVVRAGVVAHNAPTTGAFSGFPFLGVRCSGNGRAVGAWTIDHGRHPVACTIGGRM